MNNLPRQMLRQIVAKHGKEICRDARRCENLLKDLCGSHQREINVLVNAIDERIPLDLLAGNRAMPLEMLLNRLEKKLEEQTALTADAARWAVESWALALNLITERELQARRKQIETVAPPDSKTVAVQPDESNGGAVLNDNRRHPVQPPRAVPPVIRQPSYAPHSAPPVVIPANNPPVNSPSVQSPTTSQPVIKRKSFGLFRGCLILVFLLAVASVVLLLGVPFAIEKMRETQRERNSESPRFLVR